jgi:hypothetical protein
MPVRASSVGRPRGFSPPRRFAPQSSVQACCILLPTMGFAAFATLLVRLDFRRCLRTSPRGVALGPEQSGPCGAVSLRSLLPTDSRNPVTPLLGAPDVPSSLLPLPHIWLRRRAVSDTPPILQGASTHRSTYVGACTRHPGLHLNDYRPAPAASPSTLRSRGLSRPIPCTLSTIANDAFLSASRNPLSSLVAPAALRGLASPSLHSCPHLAVCTSLLTVSSAGEQTTQPRSVLHMARCRDHPSYRYYCAQSTPGLSSIRWLVAQRRRFQHRQTSRSSHRAPKCTLQTPEPPPTYTEMYALTLLRRAECPHRSANPGHVLPWVFVPLQGSSSHLFAAPHFSRAHLRRADGRSCRLTHDQRPRCCSQMLGPQLISEALRRPRWVDGSTEPTCGEIRCSHRGVRIESSSCHRRSDSRALRLYREQPR